MAVYFQKSLFIMAVMCHRRDGVQIIGVYRLQKAEDSDEMKRLNVKQAILYVGGYK
mgnify:CR=1 FL=1